MPTRRGGKSKARALAPKSKASRSTTLVSGKSRTTPSVPLAKKARIPKPMMSISSRSGSKFMDHISVSGVEVFSTTLVSSTFSVAGSGSLFINPLNSALFPKLAALAALFEKWKRGGSLTFRYHANCPATLSGSIAGYVEPDVADTSAPANIIAVLQEELSTSASVWEDCAIVFPPGEQSLNWMFTQAAPSTEVEGDRTSFDGIIRWYTQYAAAADIGKFTGYLSVEYKDIQFSIFRPPTSTGFELMNINPQSITVSGVAQTIRPTDENIGDYGNLGPSAGRSIWTLLKDFLTSGTAYPESQIDYVVPPRAATTDVSAMVTFNGHTDSDYFLPDRSCLEVKGSSLARPKLVRQTVMSDTKSVSNVSQAELKGQRLISVFEPYLSIQHSDGTWWYIEYPKGPEIPYAGAGVEDLFTPQAAGDVTIQVIADNADGTSTVLWTTGVINMTSAGTVTVSGSVLPSLTTFIKLVCTAVYTTQRVITAVRWLIGPARTNSP